MHHNAYYGHMYKYRHRMKALSMKIDRDLGRGPWSWEPDDTPVKVGFARSRDSGLDLLHRTIFHMITSGNLVTAQNQLSRSRMFCPTLKAEVLESLSDSPDQIFNPR
jgi:hypothetical protein